MTLSPDLVELGRHVDRTTRRSSGLRPDVTVVGLSRGWGRLAPGPEGEFASSSNNRVYWSGLDGALGADDVDEMLRELRRIGATGAFAWVSPRGCEGGGEESLTAIGAERVPWVKYLAFARRAEMMRPARESGLMVRTLEKAEVAPIMSAVWEFQSASGVTAGQAMVERGYAEVFAAFDGQTPVAVGALVKDPETSAWAYLGWAGTHKDHRGRGAQTALIAARVSRAAELGAQWCVSETNTVVEVSLKNLMKCGFSPVVEWRVFRVTGVK